MKLILALAIVILATGSGQAAAESPPPDWYLEEIELLTSGSGRWEADNIAYKSDEEQFDAYVTEWRSSFDGLTMTVSDQEFSAPDGRQWRAGHRSYFPDNATHVTDSFDIVDDLWTERRSYTWKKVTPQENAE
jgi:hypothetical protein